MVCLLILISNLLSLSILLDWPAARIILVILYLLSLTRFFSRLLIVFNRPPTPIADISLLSILLPDNTLSNTQSNPFKLGDLAQPGNPIIVFFCIFPNSNKLPGSTGIPNLIIVPPLFIIASGILSLISTIADEPKINIRSTSVFIKCFIIPLISLASCLHVLMSLIVQFKVSNLSFILFSEILFNLIFSLFECVNISAHFFSLNE